MAQVFASIHAEHAYLDVTIEPVSNQNATAAVECAWQNAEASNKSNVEDAKLAVFPPLNMRRYTKLLQLP